VTTAFTQFADAHLVTELVYGRVHATDSGVTVEVAEDVYGTVSATEMAASLVFPGRGTLGQDRGHRPRRLVTVVVDPAGRRRR
jgi:hypothetical protein